MGKAKHLKNRVSSYFQPPARLGPKTAALVAKIATIDHIEVASELEALLLESRLIKKFKPFYNLAAKDDKSPYYIHVTRESYPKPVINHDPRRALAGPFLNRLIPSRILRQFRRVTPYCTAPRPVRRPCLYAHLGLCFPCPGGISTPDQAALYQAHISKLRRLLRGQFASVKSQLTRDMHSASRNQNFELAAHIRNHLSALSALSAAPVLPDDYLVNPNLTSDRRQAALSALSTHLHLPSLHRIEMYDAAHLAGSAPTAAMTVAIDGLPNSNQYRHFTIKHASSTSDVDMLHEVLSRRLKAPWPLPDLFVLDGGVPQLSRIRALSLPAPVIALAKQAETLVIPEGSSYRHLVLPRTDPGLQLLQQLRDEAHRFSRRLHHRHRAKMT